MPSHTVISLQSKYRIQPAKFHHLHPKRHSLPRNVFAKIENIGKLATNTDLFHLWEKCIWPEGPYQVSFIHVCNDADLESEPEAKRTEAQLQRVAVAMCGDGCVQPFYADCPGMTSRCNAKGRLRPQVPFSKLPHENAFLYTSKRRQLCTFTTTLYFLIYACVYVYYASRSASTLLVWTLRRRNVLCATERGIAFRVDHARFLVAREKWDSININCNLFLNWLLFVFNDYSDDNRNCNVFWKKSVSLRDNEIETIQIFIYVKYRWKEYPKL